MKMKLRNIYAFSLVEVLAAIAVLTLGILVILKLFPSGFFVTRAAENRSLASRLAQQEIERWKNAAASLPAGVLALAPYSDGSATGEAIDIAAHPENFVPPALPPGIDAYYYSDINRWRRVIGERVRIPIPIPTMAGQGSVYVLGAGPFVDQPLYDPVSRVWRLNNLNVYGSPMVRIQWQAQSDSPPPLRRPHQYAIDYDASDDGAFDDVVIWFYPTPYARDFTISYDYYDGNDGWRLKSVSKTIPNVASLTAEPVRIDLRSYTGPDGRPILEPNWRMRAGSELVSREFRLIPLTQAWSGDPYEFKILYGNIGPYANVGVLLFNPAGYNYTERTARGVVPLTAHIDYTVLDWHIIREDRLVPIVPGDIKLNLRFLRKRGDKLDDQTTYEGLIRGVNWNALPAGDPVRQQPDFVAVDLQTGQILDPIVGQGDSGSYRVDYRNGVVKVVDPALAGHTLRFYYQAEGDWGVQILKPYELYRERYGALLSYREFYVGGGADGGAPTRIYFPVCDAGKQVILGEVFYVDRLRGKDVLRGVLARISTQTETVAGRPLCYVDIRDIKTTAVSLDLDAYATYGYVVRDVKGASFKARVVWKENNVWQRYEVETILMREVE
jgi:type II secretory pathway pseudopilin PulG